MQRLLPPVIAILVLLIPAVILVNGWISLSPWMISTLKWLPYLIIILALMICVVFYNSREFCLFLTLFCIYILLQTVIWQKLATINKPLLFNIMGFVLALNFLIFNFRKERGLLNARGVNKILQLVAEFIVCFWLVKANSAILVSFLGTSFFPQPAFINKLLGQPLLVFWCLSLLVFAIHQYTSPALLRAAWGLTLFTLFIGLNYSSQPPVTSIYILIGALILITAIIIHAYHMAYRDELTQLPSRRALKQQLLSLGKNYSIAMIDVDHFKKLNDTYGHDAGDDVLKLLATQLQAVAGGGRPFRYGGEEFTLVFPGMDVTEATVYLNALREKIANKEFIVRRQRRRRRSSSNGRRKGRMKKINISVSIGVAEKRDKHNNPQEVIKAADEALYKAKKAGRNRVVSG